MVLVAVLARQDDKKSAISLEILRVIFVGFLDRHDADVQSYHV